MIRSPAAIAVILIGALVACLIAARAVHQDISIDEAITYRKFVDPASNKHWQADANNHVLNSILARVTTGWFGLSEFTLRLPSILAGLAYILFAAVLAELLFGRTLFTVLLFGLLVLNPFSMDYFVAARGYGLALAGQLGSLLMIAEDVVAKRRRPYLVSAFCGLTVCANFAFAITAMATLAVYFFWLHPPNIRTREQWGCAAAADALKLALPFAMLVGVVAGPIILSMPHSQLYYGTYLPIDTLRSVLRHVFPAPDGLLLPSHVAPAVKDLNRIGYWLVPALLALSPLLLFAPQQTPRDRFAVLCGAILLVTCAGHLLLLAFDIKLPLGRTALFLVPLATVIIAAVAARLEFAGMAILALLVISFLAALRTSYFDRWRVNAGIKEAVIAAGDYAKARNLTVVGTTSGEAETGGFYRRLLGYGFELLKPAQGLDLDLSVQIVDRHTNYAGPLEEAGFKVIYENRVSGMRVYAKPDGAAPTTGPGPDPKG